MMIPEEALPIFVFPVVPGVEASAPICGIVNAAVALPVALIFSSSNSRPAVAPIFPSKSISPFPLNKVSLFPVPVAPRIVVAVPEKSIFPSLAVLAASVVIATVPSIETPPSNLTTPFPPAT